MTKQTRQPRVIAIVMLELRVIRLREDVVVSDSCRQHERNCDSQTESEFPANARRRKDRRDHRGDDHLCAFAPLRETA